MGVLYSRLIGYLIWFVVVLLCVIRKAIQWIKEYKKNQKDHDDQLERQLDILKYKNSKNKQKGENHDPKR